MGWSDGYVTEIPYTYGYYEHLNPQRINLCLIYRGFRPIRWDKGFTYCELCCGHGVTVALLAALYPMGQFYAMDFNPMHIEFLRDLARSADLNNLHYTDASLAEYAEDESLPSFDYISAHGVYSWIKPENRYQIRRIVNKKLKVGGVFSVSYNTLPGWNIMQPLQYLMNIYRRGECTGDLFVKFQKAMEFIEKMRANQALFFKNFVPAELDFIKKQNPSYLIHEYFNDDWHPMYSSQVLDEMSECKLRYVGSGNLIENIPSLNLHTDAYNHIASLGDIRLQELTRDFYLNTRFRRDLYIKGGMRMSERERRSWLSGARFVFAVKRSDIEWEHQHGMVRVKLDKRFYEPILDELESGSCNLMQVYENLKGDGFNFSNFWEAIFTLLSLHYICWYVEEPGNIRSAQNFNEAIVKRACSGKEILHLAAPCLYSGISVNYLGLLFLYWEFTGKEQSLQECVMEILASLNLSLADDDGNRLDDEDKQIALLERKYEDFLARRPFWERIGVLAFMKATGQERTARAKKK